jgi:hypothetical protein
MKRLKVTVLFLFAVWSGFAQDNRYEPSFWKLLSMNGRLDLLGIYKSSNVNSIGIDNSIENKLLSGNLNVNTQSYFWHPNFLILDVAATYSPGAGKNNSILQPDYAIESVSKQVRLKTTLFRKKKLNYRTFLNYTDSYSNSENISENLNTIFDYGGRVNYRNKIAPISLNYINFNRNQNQKSFNRFFRNKGSELDVRAETSISAFDSHKAVFSQRNYNNRLVGIYENTINTTTFNLRDHVYFNLKKDKYITSYLNKMKVTGATPFKIFNIKENLYYKLPLNFTALGSYDYNDINRSGQNNKTQKVGANLQHKLYASLNTNISYEYINAKQTVYTEKSNIYYYGLNYTKKIPLKGKLNVSYNFSQHKIDRKGESVATPFFNESYVLNDTEITLIQYPDIIEESIVVKDVTGAFIYQENIDYILIQQGIYFEIQRLPGGLISNNEQVYIDFIGKNPGSYNYTLLSNTFQSNISLFNNLVNFYYRYMNRDYENVNITNTDILGNINQNVIGFKFRYKAFEFGAEKDHYKSNIVPYKLNSYFANVNGRLNAKMSYTFNTHIRDYDMIAEEGRTQLFVSASGNLSYNFNYKTILNVTAGYRKQEGEGIDLDLFTARAGLTTSFNQLILKLSADIYKRNYLLTEDYNYNAINLRITRRF